MTLFPELWYEVLDCCSPLSLFFLEKTCLSFRSYLTRTFSEVRVRFRVPEANSYEELAYFLSLSRGEQVKYCARHDWVETFARLQRTTSDDMYTDLCYVPASYKMLYPESRVQSIARRTGDLYFTSREEVEFLLRMNKESYRKFQLDIPRRDYYKLPLAIQREQLDYNFPDELDEEIAFYWVLTGELVGQAPADFDKREWQEYRDFVASDGETATPDDESEFFEALYYHASSPLLLKHGDFGCGRREETNTDIVLARKLLTQDEFFSYLQTEEVIDANNDWCTYFAKRGMEASYLRYKELDLFDGEPGCPSLFLESGNLSAFFRLTERGQSLRLPNWSPLDDKSELMLTVKARSTADPRL